MAGKRELVMQQEPLSRAITVARGSARAIDELLGDAPFDDRVSALVVSIITRERQSIKACLSLLSLVGIIARYGLTQSERVLLSEMVRDVADDIERSSGSML